MSCKHAQVFDYRNEHRLHGIAIDDLKSLLINATNKTMFKLLKSSQSPVKFCATSPTEPHHTLHQQHIALIEP